MRPAYAKDYRCPRVTGDARNGVNDDGGDDDDDDDYSGGAATGAKEVLPLRWIPWEVYALVRLLLLVEPLKIGRLLYFKEMALGRAFVQCIASIY